MYPLYKTDRGQPLCGGKLFSLSTVQCETFSRGKQLVPGKVKTTVTKKLQPLLSASSCRRVSNWNEPASKQDHEEKSLGEKGHCCPLHLYQQLYLCLFSGLRKKQSKPVLGTDGEQLQSCCCD